MIFDAARRGSSRSNCRRYVACLALALCSALSAGALGACATLPGAPTERALYIDARKALRAESRLGWTVDRIELAEAAVQTEQSACQVTPEARASLAAWVDQRIALLGGSAARLYQRGVPKRKLRELIDLEHTRAVLAQIAEHVPADCPFWLTPSPTFSGVNTSAHRFVVLAEGMSGGSLSFSGGKVRAGAGGGARLFASYGTSDRTQLALGIEAGGDAVLQHRDEAAFEPEGLFLFGVPVLARWTDIDRIYDLELAAVTGLNEGKFSPWGGRIALAGGVSGLRRMGFMPAVSVWLGYEAYPAQDGQPARHMIRLGTRVGIDWDP
jgi:hypothetical protein